MGWKMVEQRSNGDSWIFECEDCKATVEFDEEAILLRGHIVEERERGIEVGEDDDRGEDVYANGCDWVEGLPHASCSGIPHHTVKGGILPSRMEAD
jgi:hypothetical protein